MGRAAVNGNAVDCNSGQLSDVLALGGLGEHICVFDPNVGRSIPLADQVFIASLVITFFKLNNWIRTDRAVEFNRKLDVLLNGLVRRAIVA